MTAAVLKISPVDAPAMVLPVIGPSRLTELLDLTGAPPWFAEHGVVRIDGHVIPQENWRKIIVKPGQCQVIEFAVVPGNRKALLLMATVATVALAASVSGGLLGPLGLGLGATFSAGGLGATAAAAGIGIAGQLLVSALTAPPKAAGQEAGNALGMAGIAGNTAQLLAPLPVVMGTMRVSPPLLAPVYTTLDNGEVIAHAVVGVEGRCAISDLLINGVDASLIESLEYETFEGTPGDAARTIATLSVMEQRDGIDVVNFRTALNSAWNERLLNQDTPDESAPDWNYFETDGRWDEIWLRFVFRSGIVAWDTGGESCVPIRIEIRKKGDVDWRRIPTVYAYDPKGGSGSLRVETKLIRATQPSGPHWSNSGGERPVIEINATTGIGQSFEYEADPYFISSGLGSSVVPDMTGYTTGGVTLSASSEQGGNQAWKANDGAGGKWKPSATSFNHWIKIDLGSAQSIGTYTFVSDTGSPGLQPDDSPLEWYWEGSTDDVTYTRLDEENVRLSVVTQVIYGQIGYPGSYRYYKMTILDNNGAASAAIQVGGLRLYTPDCPGTAMNDDYYPNYGALTLHNATVDPRSLYGSITPDGCAFYLDPAEWDDGAYEVRVKRGVAFVETNMVWPSHNYDGSPTTSDFFEYRLSSGYYVVSVGQRDYRSDMQVEVFSTVDYAEPFAPTGVAMIAVKVPNFQINSISALFSGYAPTWDGTIWSETESETANPAAWLRKMLLTAPNPRPIPGEIIDDGELGGFYDRCVAAGHEVNAIINGRTVGDAMQMAASCGYASPRAAETWGVVEDYDTSALPVSQAISPLNSRDLGTEIAIPDTPHAIHAEYFDADDDYAIARLTVYADGHDAATATVFEAHTYDGFTDATKLQTRVEFDLRQTRMRSARYAREMGQEGFTIRRGHVVLLADDVLDGVVAYGIVRSVTTSGGLDSSVTLDAAMPFSQAATSMADMVSSGRPMALLVRLDDGTVVEKLVTDITDGTVCHFADPPDTGTILAGQLAVCGFYGSEKRRCRVMGVEPTGIDSRIVYLADEAPELFGGSAVTIEPAEGLIAEAPNGLAIMFIYRSMSIKDAGTPANNYSGDPSGALTFTRASVASVWRESVLLTALDSGEFALDTEPVAATGMGLRVEGSSTNLCLRSAEMDNANWIKGDTTVTANATTAPDGTVTADAVIEDATTATHSIAKNSLAVTADNTYAWSVYIKPVTGGSTRYPVLNVTIANANSATRAGVAFDLANVASQSGLVTGSGPAITDKGIEALPNGWYRIWIAASVGGGDATIGFGLASCQTYANQSNGESYLGDGVSGFYVWGGQIEDGQNFPTSYMPTTSAAVTRSADSVSIPVADFGYDTTRGTISIVGRTAPGNNASQVFAQFDDGTESNRIRIVRDFAGDVHCIVTDGGVEQADIDLGAVANGARFGVSLSWVAGNINASLNGATAIPDTPSAATIPVGITTLWLGRSSTSLSRCFGHIERVRHIKTRATNTQLPALSAI